MNAPAPKDVQRYTLAEIAEALGVSKQAAQKRAHKEEWYSEPAGRGRAYPESALPLAVRQALSQRAIAAVLPAIAAEIAAPIVLQAPEALLTDRQKLERDARAGVKTAIARTMVEGRCSQEAALQTLLINARAGSLDAATTRMLQLARDKRGRKSAADDGFPSIRSLKRWLTAADLAPKVRQKDMSVPPWAGVFLQHYQRPEKPSVESAYREACATWYATGTELPSVHAVRRFLKKMGEVTRERGRMGPRELKNIRPFVRRDFSHLEPNDIWTADGHTFDAEVQHPFHGRPFRPEITLFLDIATRRAVGWSVDLAESGIAVVDALRHGVTQHGIPAMLYVDNGSGYKNAMIKDEATGLMGRIGCTLVHSLPYNSQARGVIERAHKTLWVDGAKLLPGYVGAAMDREARLAQFKLTRRAIRGGGAMPLLPWALFVQWVEERVRDYNARGHRSLNGLSPDLAWSGFTAKGWSAERLSADEAETLFRPRVTRKLDRAEIRLFNNIYFARELEEFHGLTVHVAYDIHDASRVRVHLPDGRFLCEAEVNGNRKHYYPVPVVQQAREKRAQGRLQKVDAKREEILEELRGAPAIAAPAASQIVIGGRILDATSLSSAAEPLPIEAPQALTSRRSETPEATLARSERSAEENYNEWLEIGQRMSLGESVNAADARWHESYQRSAQFRAESKKRKAAA